MSSTLVTGIGELVTCDGTGAAGAGIRGDHALVVQDGRIAWIGAAAEAANHHPDLELGWGRVAVRLVSHDVSGLTSRDLRMARTVSQILAGEGLAAEDQA